MRCKFYRNMLEHGNFLAPTSISNVITPRKSIVPTPLQSKTKAFSMNTKQLLCKSSFLLLTSIFDNRICCMLTRSSSEHTCRLWRKKLTLRAKLNCQARHPTPQHLPDCPMTFQLGCKMMSVTICWNWMMESHGDGPLCRECPSMKNRVINDVQLD